MIHVNDNPHYTESFLVPNYEDGTYAKALVGGERFWIKDVKPSEDGEIGVYVGVIDNDLCFEDVHGLACNDVVSFKPEGLRYSSQSAKDVMP